MLDECLFLLILCVFIRLFTEYFILVNRANCRRHDNLIKFSHSSSLAVNYVKTILIGYRVLCVCSELCIALVCGIQ